MTEPTGWHPDPSGRYEFRWFNGTAWTRDVSVSGVRYLDDLAGSVHPGGRPSSAPTGTMAVIGFVLGLAALLVAWMPFVFVLAGIAAVAAITLGIVVVRRARSGRALRHRLAVAGLVLGVAALALCPVGVVLTAKTIDEFDAYTNPGPVDIVIDLCEQRGVRLVVEGTITNLDDTIHDYDIAIRVMRGARKIDLVHRAVRDVPAGAASTWATSTIVGSEATAGNGTIADGTIADGTAGEATVADYRCEVFAVNGPFPFGLDPV